MKRLFSMALKDLVVLSRDKMGTFFIVGLSDSDGPVFRADDGRDRRQRWVGKDENCRGRPRQLGDLETIRRNAAAE